MSHFLLYNLTKSRASVQEDRRGSVHHVGNRTLSCVQCLLNRKVIFTWFFWPASPTSAPFASLKCQRSPCPWHYICSLSRKEETLKHINHCGQNAFFPLHFSAFEESRRPKDNAHGLPCNQSYSPGSLQIMKTDLWHSPFSESRKYFLTTHFGLLKDKIPYFWSVLPFLYFNLFGNL